MSAHPPVPRPHVLVVGSGMAGLTFALEMAGIARVTILTKKRRADSNTNWARGGIAAAVGEDDDPSLHLRDTLEAGGGLCQADAVRVLVSEGPARVRELLQRGARFARSGEGFRLGREGGHSRRRIVHSGDRTGGEIERTLLAAVAAREDIEVVEDALVVDLLVDRSARGGRRVVGATVLDGENRLRSLEAEIVFLATGGSGQAWLHTTNPLIATGDGVAVAWRAGAALANLEFVQFHPTALVGSGDPAFLISEALRGEGAVLRRIDGTSVMQAVDPRGSLAPRDIVARAIDQELRRTGDPWVVLDVGAIPEPEFAEHFPEALAACRRAGIDPRDGIPVVPAAHYQCGGIWTDLEGRSTLPGLFAAGEVACTGVHGANRLASNSLLEALVFSWRAARAAREALGGGILRGADLPPSPDLRWVQPFPSVPPSGQSAGRTADAAEETEDLGAARVALRELAWRCAGIVRSDEGIRDGQSGVAELFERGRQAAGLAGPGVEAMEFLNLVTLVSLVLESAAGRRESRGLHYTVDHPVPSGGAPPRDTVLLPEEPA